MRIPCRHRNRMMTRTTPRCRNAQRQSRRLVEMSRLARMNKDDRTNVGVLAAAAVAADGVAIAKAKEPAAARRDEPRQQESRFEDRPIDPIDAEEDADDDDFDLPLHGIRESDDSTLDDQDDDDDHELKANHRGIPTWDEAIGMIVGANLESSQLKTQGANLAHGVLLAT